MGSFGPKCDVWSAGCVLFELLAGQMPFITRSLEPNDWLALHKKGPDWSMVKTSELGTGLCRSMLVFSDSKRPTMSDSLKHKWFSANHQKMKEIPADALAPLQSFHKETALKRSLLLEIIARLPMERAGRIVEVFKRLDSNHDGRISKDELKTYFHKVGLKDDKLLEKSFEALDFDGDGILSFSEFTAGILLGFKDLLDERFLSLFRKHDKNSDGALSKEEALEFVEVAMELATRGTHKKPKDVLGELFQGGSDKLNFEELKKRLLT